MKDEGNWRQEKEEIEKRRDNERRDREEMGTTRNFRRGGPVAECKRY